MTDPETAPDLPTQPRDLPGSGPVRLAAHLTAVAMGAAVLGVGVHVVRTASRLLRH